MDKDPDSFGQFDKLRQKAEALIKKCPPVWEEASTDMLQLIHELNIHQAELEIQNQELLRAQEELAQLHQKYADLYEFAPCTYVTLTREKKISQVNLTGIAQLGNPRQRLISSVFTQFVHPGFQDGFVAALAKSGRSGEKQTLEFRLNQQHAVWVRADILADRNEHQEVVQWRMTLVDISQRISSDNEKDSLQEKLHQIQKMDSLGTLAGGIAHEFNNLLAVILGNTDLARADIPASHPAAESLEEISKAGHRAKEIVQQLLVFTRMKTKTLVPLTLKPVVQEALKLIKSSIPAHIEIQSDLPDGLVNILGDATQIHQILLNLCGNAAHAMADTGGVLSIRLSSLELTGHNRAQFPHLLPGPHVKLTVQDTGHGMDPQTREKMFDPYFTTKAANQGTGLGLSMVHGIMQEYGGAITVESSPGRGTSFTLVFPGTPLGELTRNKKNS